MIAVLFGGRADGDLITVDEPAGHTQHIVPNPGGALTANLHLTTSDGQPPVSTRCDVYAPDGTTDRHGRPRFTLRREWPGLLP